MSEKWKASFFIKMKLSIILLWSHRACLLSEFQIAVCACVYYLFVSQHSTELCVCAVVCVVNRVICVLFIHYSIVAFISSDWLFYSGFWVNQSPSSSSSFFGYCLRCGVSLPSFLFVDAIAVARRCHLVHKGQKRHWLDSCSNVLKYALCVCLCAIIYICMYVWLHKQQ